MVNTTVSGGQVTDASVSVTNGGTTTQVALVTFATAVDVATFDNDTLFVASSGAVTS